MFFLIFIFRFVERRKNTCHSTISRICEELSRRKYGKGSMIQVDKNVRNLVSNIVSHCNKYRSRDLNA